MSRLLINEPPLQVLPSLAVKIGLNEAIVLQQIHYWLDRSKTSVSGHLWVYNSVTEWRTHLNLTIDHKHPVSLGGWNDIDNLQAMCMPCNAKKGARVQA